MKQALDALDQLYLPGELDRVNAVILALNERLAHCDRCGKKMGKEGDIHTCTPPGLNLDPTPISGWGQQSIGMGIPVQPEQEPVYYGPSSSVFGLAEMILSDCGHSSNYQPLLNRVAARIMGYIDTPPAAAQPAPAQPEQEPVAWMFQHGETGRMSFVSNDGMNNPELFLAMNPRYALVCALVTPPAAPRTWVGLTDEDKHLIELSAGITEDDDGYIVSQMFKLTEAKLKERNT
jgi:hypothetical protein